MPYQTDLEVALRDWGLSDYLHLVNGHRTRGSSVFNPKGSTNHHTAGSISGSIPTLNILINGHGSLPGPLCNVGQSRSSNFNTREFDDIYLVACGRANHAGRGGFRGLVGNSSVFGLEIEHCGVLSREGFSDRRMHTAWRVHNAFMQVGGFSYDMVHQHEEWAPTRKIDFVDANFTGFRNGVEATRLSSLWTPGQDEDSGDDDEMWETFIVWSYNDARGNGNQVNPSYDVRKSDPGGFRGWMISVAKQKNASDRMDVINFLRYSLGREVGKNIPLY